ncbi:hypothetical protein N6N99_27110, partial [Escherichia coli]|uniref:hypothetical protein n=1 Tax=Escherichia coli TaxID=562 RepID=UPI00234CF355
ASVAVGVVCSVCGQQLNQIQNINQQLWGGDQFWAVLNMKKIAFRPCVARVCGVSLDSGLF